MRLDVNDPKLFDRWRELYWTLSQEENIALGYALEAKYPHQASFNAEPVLNELRGQKDLHILEFGGWKGELAHYCFTHYPSAIRHWDNVDMCKAAVEKTLPELERLPYTPIFPMQFDWFRGQRTMHYDLFVSMHTIEHLADDHLRSLFRFIEGIPKLILEAPITEDGQKWDGYEGTHILEMGWREIREILSKKGYSARQVTDWVYIFEGGR